MLQPRITSGFSTRESSLTALASAFNNLALCHKHASRVGQSTFKRNASHAAQGRANGPKDSAGRRLGAKKTASEYVIPGNIIFKQRGTKWFPGENVGIGKDHTIYAKVAGYVRYYRNPAIHPERRYIGVALEKQGQGSQLPTPPNAPIRRRLGMYTTPIKEPQFVNHEANHADFLEAHIADPNTAQVNTVPVPAKSLPQTMRRDGLGIANFEIGRAAERRGIKVKDFDKNDRWLAWRKRAKKVKEKMAARAARSNRKTKGKKSNKKVKIAGK